MSSIPGISHPPIPSAPSLKASTPTRPSDGDTAAREAAETPAAKTTEAQNGGSAPSKNIVNKTA